MNLFQELWQGVLATTTLEFIAVTFGIASVLFSRKENILVFPTGLVNTTLYIYLAWIGGLYAEAGVNFYYTLVSIYGWIVWSRSSQGTPTLKISLTSRKEWVFYLSFFILSWTALYILLNKYTDSNVPFADAFTSASAYTGMIGMARKKVSSWIWWMITNLANIPLYFAKGYVFTSFQFLVFLIIAVSGYTTWKNAVNAESKNS